MSRPFTNFLSFKKKFLFFFLGIVFKNKFVRPPIRKQNNVTYQTI